MSISTQEKIKYFKNKFNGILVDKFGPKGGIKFIAIVGIVIWTLSGIYIIDPGEKGVVKRFGSFQQETGQGLHYHMPFPIESLSRVNVSQNRTSRIFYNKFIKDNNFLLNKETRNGQ